MQKLAIIILFASAVMSYKDLDYINSRLSQEKSNNCGRLSTIALSEYQANLMHRPDFKTFTEIFTSSNDKIDCRAVVNGNYFWVKLYVNDEEKRCQMYIPLNAINLFRSDKTAFPVLAEEQIESTLRYNKCKFRGSEIHLEGESFLSQLEEEAVAGMYVNYKFDKSNIDVVGLNADDKEAVLDQIESGKLVEVVAEIKKLSEEGQDMIKDFVEKNITEDNIAQIRKNADAQVVVETVAAHHPEFEKDIPSGLMNTADEDEVEMNDESNEDSNEDKKYLKLEQMGGNASYCDDEHKRRVLSLYNAKATAGELKTIQVWTQNIVECLTGYDNTQFKAVLKINKRSCLFNVVIDTENARADLIPSSVVGLTACHM